MNGRIVELAKNPELFQINDLELINSELKKHPYMQSLRALHLLGIHRLQPENYKNELSITAAYTTDKKILYQLINSGKESKPAVESNLKLVTEKPIFTEEVKNKFTEVESVVIETPNPVFVNGELNRILFEGEEDFLERETEKIDLESTIESGKIVTQKSNQEIISTKVPEFDETEDAEKFSKETIVEEEIISLENLIIENPKEVSFQETEEFLPNVKVEAKEEILENKQEQEFTETKDAENFSKEKVIQEENISEEKPIIEDLSEISFHGTAEFLPEVKIIAKPIKAEFKEAPKPTLNKHEEEMNQLIAKVEAKMKASKKQKTSSTETDETAKSTDVNFSETQTFNFSKPDDNEAEITEEKSEIAEVALVEEPLVAEISEVQPTEIPKEAVELKTDSIQESKPEWKPMSFHNNTPDALISKKAEEIPVKKEEVEEEKKLIKKEEIPAAERPIFNVSFFSENVSSLNKKEEKEPIPKDIKTTETTEDSNVPNFINTWQSWLKIDRNKEEAKEKIEISITEIKNKVIENFIEKEPKISKLKGESDFVIKEKNDDISHLMTETLANLYTDQKLFAKAIKAYGILSNKHPEKKSYFEDKIKSVKELRQNK